MFKQLKNKKGFTLIEIIVVMVLIGTLALVIVPKYTANVAKGRITSTKSNLESLRSAIALYTTDNGGVLPASNLSSLVPTYLRAIPDETITPTNAVVTTLDGAGGWYYDTANNEIYPNLSGNDAEGKAYSTY